MRQTFLKPVYKQSLKATRRPCRGPHSADSNPEHTGPKRRADQNNGGIFPFVDFLGDEGQEREGGC